MLAIKDISKSYGNRIALGNVSFTLMEGVAYGLIGPNGAGKSTLMKIISQIIQADEGNIQGFDSNYKQNIGYVPQEICLEEKLSALDNLKFFGRIYGLKGKKLAERANEVLTMVGLEGRAKERIETFSGGMKRRINIGCALLHNPKLVIMDEPTVGIDPQSRNHIFELIAKLKKEGKTILYSSHYMEEVEQICDELMIMDHGKVLEKGTLEQFLSKHKQNAVYIEGKGITEEQLRTYGKTETYNAGWNLFVENPLQTISQIASDLRDHAITRLEIRKTNLQEIFLDMTGAQLRD